jgi:hypothetical protein
LTHVVGFTGRKGTGKDTAAEVFVAQGAVGMKFAAPLKAMLAVLFRYQGADDTMVHRMLEGDLKETPSTYLMGNTPRWAMQTLGTEWGRGLMGENFWVEIFRNAAEQYDTVVVSDVRFPNEVDIITEDMGGVVYRVVKANSGSNDRHPSEAGIDNLEVTGEVLNTALSAGDFQDEIFRLFHAGSENVH